MTEYVFDNKEAETEQRFGALEALFDPISQRHLEPYVFPGRIAWRSEEDQGRSHCG